MYSASGPFGEASGRPVPVAVENFHALKARQTAEAYVPTPGSSGEGQPAQLGRRGPAGHAGRPTRRHRARGRPAMTPLTRSAAEGHRVPRAPPAAAPPQVAGGQPAGARLSARDVAATRLACSWLLAYPDGELLDRLDGLAAAVGELPEPGALPCRSSWRTWTAPDRRRPAALRRDVRHASRMPVPDLLDPRRHPQPRHGDRCTSRRPTTRRVDDRRRSCPTTWPWCSSSPRPVTGSPATPCSPSTAASSRCCTRPCTTRIALRARRGGDRGDPAGADPGGRAAARMAAARRVRDPRSRTSASSRSRQLHWPDGARR